MATQGPAKGIQPPIKPQTNPADIVFCVDCTGSMDPCFKGLVQNLHNFVEGLQSEKKVDFRLKFIEYRDLKIGESIKPRAFTSDVEEFRRQLGELEATGGGDEPESTLDAIYVALNSEWRPGKCHKAVLVFTDAPSHPELHESTVASGTRDIETVINVLEAKRAWLYIVSVEDPLYERFAKREKTMVKLHPKDKRYEGLKGVDFAQVLEWLGKTISSVSDVT